jgi:hypothetical protein
MRRWIGMLLLVLTLTPWAFAQEEILPCGDQVWRYDRHGMSLQWKKINPLPVDGIRIKIGTEQNAYTVVKDFSPPEYLIALPRLVPGPGLYYARAWPLYKNAEGVLLEGGEASDECFFRSELPADPAKLEIQFQRRSGSKRPHG